MANQRSPLEDLVATPVMKGPLVSVVTPVYNGEAHLAECIESVLAQTFTDFEYVLLDNASTDATAAIIEKYAALDPRIIPQKNDHTLPIIENWNRAVSFISPHSDYCKVVHADDLIVPDCLELMVDSAQRHPSATLIGAYRIDGVGVNLDSIPYPIEFVEGRELARGRLQRKVYRDQFGSPTSVMYRSDEVRSGDAFYDVENFHADTQICFELLARGDYAFVHKILSYTRRHEGAQTPAALRLATPAIANLKILKKLGPTFLKPTEYSAALRKQLRAHYRILARDFRFITDAEIRQLHVAYLRESGLGFSLLRISVALVQESLEKLVRLANRVG